MAAGTASVLVVGDSVTHMSEDELRKQMSWTGNLDVRASPGERTDQLLADARRGADRGPDIGVFLPGYNDVLQDTVDTGALPEMIEIAAKLPCSVWLLLPRAIPLHRNLVVLWNARVRQLAGGHPSVHVIDDWRLLVERSPDFTFVKHVDGVHPDQRGQEALAKVMSNTARAQCTSGG